MNDFSSIDSKMIPFLIIYAVIMIISIILYRIWYKKYKNIPDKQVTAKLIKTSNYFGDGGPENTYASRVSYTLAKYEYYIENKRNIVKLTYTGTVPDEVTLYYKKGKSDIRLEKSFSLPFYAVVLSLVYFVIGIAAITVIIGSLFGFKI